MKRMWKFFLSIAIVAALLPLQPAGKTLASTEQSYATQIAAGDDHNLVLKSDGTVWMWGNYESNSDIHSSPIPTSVTNAVYIAAGGGHSLVLDDKGQIQAWGINANGQLGLGNTDLQEEPQPLKVVEKDAQENDIDVNFKAIAAGNNHSLALDSKGHVWAWGRNNNGQLGLGNMMQFTTPQRLKVTETDDNGNDIDVSFRSIAAGSAHSLALDDKGHVWVWGYNWNGQLGLGNKTQFTTPQRLKVTETDDNGNDIDVSFRSIAAGNAHSLALDDKGQVWTWGRNNDGQLGLADTGERTVPVKIGDSTNFSNIQSISAGNAHTFALDDRGQVWAWGNNRDGQLGLGDKTQRTTPVKIENVPDFSNIQSIAAGYSHSLFLKGNGTVWSTGMNDIGQLGDGIDRYETTPVKIEGVLEAVNISAGWSHSLALDREGQVWIWGYNEYGELGLGDHLDRSSPVLTTVTNAVDIAAGGEHNLALDTLDQVWVWGANWDGQLGLGDGVEYSAPQQLTVVESVYGNDVHFKAIAAGDYHSLALDDKGSVWAWGSNSDGQLGLGDTVHRTTPQPLKVVEQDANGNDMDVHFKAIAAGGYHSLALDDKGHVWVWGYNWSGQLGLGDTVHRTTPQKLDIKDANGNDVTFKSLTAGYEHTLALDGQNHVWGWGNNSDGQLFTSSPIPVKLAGFSNISTLAAGGNHSLAADGSGKVWAWGNNNEGQLGNGTRVYNFPPDEVTLSNVKSLAIGNSHSLFLDYTGIIWASGDSEYGRLGNGAMGYRITPHQLPAFPSNNADLSGLTLSQGTLNFASETTHYDMNVANNASSLTVTATKVEKTATIALNVFNNSNAIVYAEPLDSGLPSSPIPLSVGSNRIEVTIKAPNGTLKTYTIQVTRALSGNADLNGLTLSNGTLSFATATTSYNTSVANNVNSLTVTPTTADSAAKVTMDAYDNADMQIIDAESLASGQASSSIPLSVGNNRIEVTVTAQNGTTKTYTVHVVRMKSGNADLSGLTLSNGTLSFASATTSYDVHVANNIVSLTVTATKADSAAGLTLSAFDRVNTKVVDAVNLTSGLASSSIPLSVGSNRIEVTVTAADGTVKTYTVNVSRASTSGGGSSSSSPAPSPSAPPEEAGIVTLDGKDMVAEVTKETTEDGQAVSKVTIDGERLIQAFASSQNSLLSLTIQNTDPVVSVDLPAGALLNTASSNPNAIVQINVDGASYSLPVSTLANVPSDAVVTVVISKISGQANDAVNAAAARLGSQQLLDNPIDYHVSVNGEALTDFDGVYVQRTFTINFEVDADKVTAVWVDESNNLHFIPSIVTSDDGVTTVTMYSPHNSIYTAVQSDHAFMDLQSHWAKADVELLANKLIVNGVANNSFAPDHNITRAEFAAMLVRSLALIEVKKENSYTDVKATDWFAGAVSTAQQAGLIQGFEDGTFQPDANITREQMVTMIVRALKVGGVEVTAEKTALNQFNDRDSIADWSKDAAAQTLTANIIQGMTDNTFAAKEHATRAQAAVMLKRMLQYLQFINSSI